MTMNSGQVFHWEKVGAGFYGTIEDRATYVEQRGATLRVATEGGAVRRDDKTGVVNSAPGSRELAPPVSELVRHYFALDHRLDEICASFPRDPAMNAARDFCRGLRIVRQPKWECLATFICSSMKQVAHIRQISRSLREQFGEQRRIDPPSPRLRRGDTVVLDTFPTVERIAEGCEHGLRKCGRG